MGSLRELFTGIFNSFKFWFVVAPWEQAVLVRGGKNPKVVEAGIRLRIPFLDRVYRQSIRKRFSPVPTQTVTTLDGKIITLTAAISYQIEDIGQLYNTLHDAEDVIQTTTQGAIAGYVSLNNLETTRPGNIEKYVLGTLDFENCGIKILSFSITTFAVTRTYRLIQGNANDYSYSETLNTTRHTDE